MKTMIRKFISFGIAVCFVCLSVMNVNAAEIKDSGSYSRLNIQGISEGVEVYHNAETGYKYAIFEPDGFDVGDEVVLYHNEQTGEKVSIIYDSFTPNSDNKQRLSGSSAWSAGYFPDGKTVYTAKLTGLGAVDVKLKTEVNAYPIVVQAEEAKLEGGLLYGTNSGAVEHTIISEATTARPAHTQRTFTYFFRAGVIGDGSLTILNPGSCSGYLSFYVNEMGQFMTSWYY